VDKFNDLLVSCYNTAGHARLLLLHDSRLSEENIRGFFQEVHELYLKARCGRAYATPQLQGRADNSRLAALRLSGHAQPVPHAHHAHHVAAL
jgi:hypothetical protein